MLNIQFFVQLKFPNRFTVMQYVLLHHLYEKSAIYVRILWVVYNASVHKISTLFFPYCNEGIDGVVCKLKVR